jgi:hypothetical protein
MLTGSLANERVDVCHGGRHADEVRARARPAGAPDDAPVEGHGHSIRFRSAAVDRDDDGLV